MTFRPLLFLVAVATAAFLPASALAQKPELVIDRVFTGWRDAASFKRISEYFTGRENTGGEVVIRTHPEQRAGYYFLVRTSTSGAPVAVKINLQLILPSNLKPQSYSFPAELAAGGTVLSLGLTGDDWPGVKTNPVAWKLDILAADGRLLATEKSYLWEKPADQ